MIHAENKSRCAARRAGNRARKKILFVDSGPPRTFRRKALRAACPFCEAPPVVPGEEGFALALELRSGLFENSIRWRESGPFAPEPTSQKIPKNPTAGESSQRGC